MFQTFLQLRHSYIFYFLEDNVSGIGRYSMMRGALTLCSKCKTLPRLTVWCFIPKIIQNGRPNPSEVTFCQ